MCKENFLLSKTIQLLILLVTFAGIQAPLFCQDDNYTMQDPEIDLRTVSERIGDFHINVDRETEEDSDYDSFSENRNGPSRYEIRKTLFQKNYDEYHLKNNETRRNNYLEFRIVLYNKFKKNKERLLNRQRDQNKKLKVIWLERQKTQNEFRKKEKFIYLNEQRKQDEYREKIRLKYLENNALSEKSKYLENEMSELVLKAQKHLASLENQLSILGKNLREYSIRKSSNFQRIEDWYIYAESITAEIVSESMHFFVDILLDKLSPNSKIGKSILKEFKLLKKSIKRSRKIDKISKKKIGAKIDLLINFLENIENIKKVRTVNELRGIAFSKDSDYKKFVDGATLLFEQVAEIAKDTKVLKKLKKPISYYIKIPKYIATVGSDMAILLIVLNKVNKLEKKDAAYDKILEDLSSNSERIEKNIAALRGCLLKHKKPSLMRKYLKSIDLDFHIKYSK